MKFFKDVYPTNHLTDEDTFSYFAAYQVCKGGVGRAFIEKLLDEPPDGQHGVLYTYVNSSRNDKPRLRGFLMYELVRAESGERVIEVHALCASRAGAFLLQALENVAASFGCKHIVLSSTMGAYGFYRAAGYSRTEAATLYKPLLERAEKKKQQQLTTLPINSQDANYWAGVLEDVHRSDPSEDVVFDIELRRLGLADGNSNSLPLFLYRNMLSSAVARLGLVLAKKLQRPAFAKTDWPESFLDWSQRWHRWHHNMPEPMNINT
jgi:hypothetical protein